MSQLRGKSSKSDKEPPKDEKNSSSSSETEGEGLKILTPNQLLARLPMLNNLLFVSTKNMSKTVYNHLMNSL